MGSARFIREGTNKSRGFNADKMILGMKAKADRFCKVREAVTSVTYCLVGPYNEIANNKANNSFCA